MQPCHRNAPRAPMLSACTLAVQDRLDEHEDEVARARERLADGRYTDKWERAADEALLDTAVEWRDFQPLRGFADVTFASKTGRVPGLVEPKDGQSWAGVEFPPETARTKWRRYVSRLGTFVPLHAMRSAIDVGGGAGIFGQVLHAQYQNLTCITLTKDNSVGPRYYFE